MQVQTWDSVFIRATRRKIHPVIQNVSAWGQWWPGMTVTAGSDSCHVSLRPAVATGGTRRALAVLRSPRTWDLQVVNNRAELGVEFRYTGAVAGEAEFYYLDEPAGTVVHYVLRGRVADRGWRAAVRDHRVGARAALNSLKDRFERDRLPGDEPPAALLHDQRDAMRKRAAQAVAEAGA